MARLRSLSRVSIVLSFAAVGGTGLFLWSVDGASTLAAWTFVAHLVLAPLLVLALLAIVLWRLRRAPRQALPVALAGVATLGTGVGSVLDPVAVRTGFVVGLHIAAGVVLFVLYLRAQRGASWALPAWTFAAIVLVALGLRVADRLDPANDDLAFVRGAAPERAGALLAPSLARLPEDAYLADARILADVARCADCHARIAREWERSAHRHSSMTNPFYRQSIEAMRSSHALADTRWCAGCHSPALLFTGRMDERYPEWDSPAARLGLTCISCHAIDPKSTMGNGDYVQGKRRPYAWETSDDPLLRKAHDVLRLVKPEGHVENLSPETIGSSAFCAVCHQATVPPEIAGGRWIAVMDDYDQWHASAYSGLSASARAAGERKTCQDCHMPRVEDRDDPAADAEGFVRSHLFAAGGTALAHALGDRDLLEAQQAFLRSAARIDIAALRLDTTLPNDEQASVLYPTSRRPLPSVRAGEVVDAYVLVVNTGSGHAFPAGKTDSKEVWIRFAAQVEDAPAFYVSGRLHPSTGRVDEEAERYGRFGLDRSGGRVVNRVGPDIHTRVYEKRVAPGDADLVRYRFRVPAGASGTLRLSAALRHRGFLRETIEALFEDGDGARETDVEHLRALPITDLSVASVELEIQAEPDAPRFAAAALLSAPDAEQLTALARASHAEGAWQEAGNLFQQVLVLSDGAASAQLDMARYHMDRGAWDRAREALREARRRRPSSPRVAFLGAELERRAGDLAEADRAYERLRARFPDDRALLATLARLRLERKRPDAALPVADRLVALAPLEGRGWTLMAQSYVALGDEARAAEVRRVAARFEPDAAERERRARYLESQPDVERLTRRVRVHVQPGLQDD